MNIVTAPKKVRARWVVPPPSTTLATRFGANVVGAVGAGFFAWAGLEHYRRTHSLVGALFLVEELWVVVAYLIRRRAHVVSLRGTDWLLAFAGTFGGVLFRPWGTHPHWGVVGGLDMQLLGLALCASSFIALGRSFGFAAADRGLKCRGPYGVVRHPLYASYFLLQGGYLLQSQSWRNAVVMAVVCSCNVGRALVEERLLASSAPYAEYRRHVRWRLVPGIW